MGLSLSRREEHQLLRPGDVQQRLGLRDVPEINLRRDAAEVLLEGA